MTGESANSRRTPSSSSAVTMIPYVGAKVGSNSGGWRYLSQLSSYPSHCLRWCFNRSECCSPIQSSQPEPAWRSGLRTSIVSARISFAPLSSTASSRRVAPAGAEVRSRTPASVSARMVMTVSSGTLRHTSRRSYSAQGTGDAYVRCMRCTRPSGAGRVHWKVMNAQPGTRLTPVAPGASQVQASISRSCLSKKVSKIASALLIRVKCMGRGEEIERSTFHAERSTPKCRNNQGWNR